MTTLTHTGTLAFLTYSWRCHCENTKNLPCPYGGYKSLHRERWIIYADNPAAVRKKVDEICNRHEDEVILGEVTTEIVRRSMFWRVLK